MASVASTARDFSRLSVSKPSSSLLTELGPLDIFGRFLGSSISFPIGSRGTDSKIHWHKVIVVGQTFTVDDGDDRQADDPENKEFLESIKNYQLPEEFSEEGMHMVRVATYTGEDEQDDEFHRLLKMRCKYRW
ncbi:uncharacterized protein LOC113315765 [Papaver somniferum]|uniref:uncharacterized protein LOC113315765 n=1 Tax=Papaver somniferum TaxID=3469 RepID=UPI000E6F5CE1|nr:uncharacterized protein LOC113315765 [Papaver somniferum]